MANHDLIRCGICRADIVDQLPQEILDEIETERIEAGSNVMGSRPRRREDDDYESADELEDDATHFKIRYGAREIGFIRNDGIDKTVTYDDHAKGVSFRIEYRSRKCYLIRKDYPDTIVPLNPLSSQCATIRTPAIPNV